MTVLQDHVLLSSGEFRTYAEFWEAQLDIKENPLPWPIAVAPHQEDCNFQENLQHLSETGWRAIQSLAGHHKMAQFTVVLAALRIMRRDEEGPCVVRLPNLTDMSPEAANPWLYLQLPLKPGWSIKNLLNETKHLLKQACESAAYPLAHALSEATSQLLQKTNLSVCFDGLGTPLKPQHASDVVLHVAPGAHGLAVKLTTTSPHDQASWRIFVDRLNSVCCCLTAPNAPITSLDLVQGKLKQQLAQWSTQTPAMPQPQFETIPSYVAAMAQAYPEMPAIWFENTNLSYAQLETRAHQLAHHLHETYHLGVGDFVGLFLEPSPRMIIAMIACMKLGAAYVPLDPHDPAARLDEKMALAQPKLMLVDSEWMYDLEAPCGVFALDLQLEGLPPTQEPLPSIPGQAPAYLIFTSGSSGKPKAVVLPQKGICQLIEGQAKAFGCKPSSRVIQFASYTFDASVSEIFVTLASGGTLYLASRNQLMPGPEMTAFFRDQAIEIATLPPAVLRVLHAKDFPDLHTVISAGEKCDAHIVASWAQGRTFINAYGPTEASVCASLAILTPTSSGDPSIGKPFGQQQLWLTNARGQLVAPGCSGDICLGGALAWGYWGQAGLTAEKFQPHPFSKEPGARLYQTGDIGRFQSSGELNYLGRSDFQVKIRGFRIELEDIERACLSLPGIKNAAVKPAEDHASLHAYLVPEEKSREVIKGHQRYLLPNGMAITHHQKGETDFIYGEVFEKQLYGTHHLTLKPGDCIFDVGANIGLFSLYAQQLCPGGTILAFEPMPPNFERLSINTDLYGPDVQIFNCGLGEVDTETSFAFYPKSTGASGRYTDQAEEEAVVRALIRNQERESGGHADTAQVEELVDGMFEKEMFEVRLRRLSDVIREQNVTQIDLLKIDVEKSEWQVLQGLEDEHWPLVRQVVLEVHDVDHRLAQIETLLKKHGFLLVVDQDSLLQDTHLYNIYAVREKAPIGAPPKLPPIRTQVFKLSAIAQQLAEKLPHYMVPNLYHILDALPLNNHGKVARQALPLECGTPAITQNQNKARTPLEEMVLALFDQILPGGIEDVDGDFFAHGGHSLLATQVISRVRDTYDLVLPLRTLFDAPTPTAFAKVVEAELANLAGTTKTRIGKTDPEKPQPLSLSQRRLWVLQQLEPESHAYNVPFAFELNGSLNIQALHRSLNTIIERHHVLRSIFPRDETPPVQSVVPYEPQPLVSHDLSDLPADEKRAALQQMQQREIDTQFCLQTPPLMRWQMLKFAPQNHVVLLTLHHIVSDGWSMGILVQEIASLYEAYLNHQPNPLPALKLQYADFAAWQHQQLEKPSMASQLSYWQHQLDHSPAETLLPLDHPRKDRQTHPGKTLKFSINQASLDGLKQLSRENHATLFMVLLAAFKTLVHRHTGQKDLCVGTVIAGRNHTDLEPLIGYFLNNLVIRTACDPRESFQSYLGKVRNTTLQAYTHQDLPFEHILSALNIPRDLAMTPLFQTLFIHQNAPVGQLQLADLQLKPLSAAQHTAKFDLTIMTMETQAGLAIHFNFNSDLYQRATIEAYANQYLHLLQHLATQQQKSLHELRMLPSQTGRVLQSPLRDLPQVQPHRALPAITDYSSLGACFTAIADAYGSHWALSDQQSRWTYAELNQAANRVANRLSLPPDTVIGLLFSNEASMVISFLGAMKAGLVVVPLDPSHPPTRLQAIFQDSGAQHLLTANRHLEVAQQLADSEVNLHTYEACAQAPDQEPGVQSRKTYPLYLLYTSGSTGKPKGVIQTHENTLFFIQRYIENLGIGSSDRLSLLASFTFDAGLMDIFGALLSGSELCLFNVRKKGLAPLQAWLEEHRISILHLVPTLYRHFLNSLGGHEPFESIRLVVLGGEAAKAGDLDLFQQYFVKDAWLVNGFGPTESTLALQAFFPWGSSVESSTLPLGDAIEGMQVMLANSEGAIIEGVGRGEIVLCSPHLAQGYHLQDTLTRQAFFYDAQGRWCYRTGDLAQRTAAGDLLHMGRKDFQVKIRGHRVEVAEIEAACLALPGVTEVAVHGHQEGESTTLCAYLVIDSQAPPNPTQARKLLTQTLPQYMIPEHFMLLQELPLTVTGKLDRTALPLPQRGKQAQAMVYVSPQTPTEKALADIWKDLLKIDMLGIHDNFFSLGAHSLTAIQAILKIRAHFLMDLPLHTLFENPTIAGLAEALADMQNQDADHDLMVSLLDALEDEKQGAQ